MLRLNCAKNGLANVVIVPAAISDDPSPIALRLAPNLNNGASTGVKTVRNSVYATQTAHTVSLDQLVETHEIAVVALMKIDIEGFELNALRSAQVSLRKGVFREIIVELHPKQLQSLGQSVDELFSLMNQFGYSRRNEGDSVIFTAPTRNHS